jgi:hypothetical protein
LHLPSQAGRAWGGATILSRSCPSWVKRGGPIHSERRGRMSPYVVVAMAKVSPSAPED